MKNARTAAFGALFRRAAALLFLLALSALAACPAFADAASTVWVDGVEITASGAELPAGVTWDGSVLTLNNANLTRTHFVPGDFREAAILANGDLTIRLTERTPSPSPTGPTGWTVSAPPAWSPSRETARWTFLPAARKRASTM